MRVEKNQDREQLLAMCVMQCPLGDWFSTQSKKTSEWLGTVSEWWWGGGASRDVIREGQKKMS